LLKAELEEKKGIINELTLKIKRLEIQLSNAQNPENDFSDERREYERLLKEKEESNINNLNEAKTTILKLKGEIQGLFNELESKSKEIEDLEQKVEDEKLSLVSTFNSHLSSIIQDDNSIQALNPNETPKFADIFDTVLSKLENLKTLITSTGADNQQIILLDKQNQELTNQLK
jgi:chromosome segregation ATPase